MRQPVQVGIGQSEQLLLHDPREVLALRLSQRLAPQFLLKEVALPRTKPGLK